MSRLFKGFKRRLNVRLQQWRNRKCSRLLRRNACNLKGKVLQSGRVFPHVENEGEINFGSNVRFRGLFVPVQLFAAKGGKLTIQKCSSINQGTTICASEEVEVGPYCRIGEYVHISDTVFHPTSPMSPVKAAPIRIGRNVWIGTRAIILPGVLIGDHSVIGSGAVVTRDVPPRTVVGGVPARPISTVECPDDWRRP
jgi:acetyltransferase-like isoleucine patch superfamily enzyme